MALDLSIILFSLITATIVIALYLFLFKQHYKSSYEESFSVIEIVRTLKKACPVQSNNQWRPISVNWSRCFGKSILLPGFKNCIKLYGATCAVACSSLYAFSLISDVSKRGEWEPCGGVILKPFNNEPTKIDHFMQASQIVDIQRGTNVQSYSAFYQFLSLPSKCTKWILFWNAKQFEFMFFLLQPAVSKNSDSHCVITHLYSTNHFSQHSANQVAQRLKNIEEFLNLSQLNIRPLGFSVSSKAESPSLKNEEEKHSFVYTECSKSDTTNTIFILVPLFHIFIFTYKKLIGYNLQQKHLNSTQQKSLPKNTPSNKLLLHENLRRTASEANIDTKENKKFELKNRIVPQKSLPLSASSDGLEKMEVIENYKPLTTEDSLDLSDKVKVRSLSDPCIEKSYLQSSVAISEDENQKSLPSIQEVEEVRYHCVDKNEMFCSSTSDFEVLDSNQQFLDSRKADYLTQGNYGASVLQTEMMLASQFDRTLHNGNRVAGGWIHSSTHKGIPVLSKSISGKVMKIFSFLCQTEIPVNFKEVWKCVKNPRFRFISDETVKTVQIVDRISESQRLIHVYHEVSGILRKEANDFCLLQTEREEKNHFYSVFQSVEYEKCPLMSAVTRGTLKPSGWIVQNLTETSCKVTYLIEILVNSPDNQFIQELHSLVPQSLYNLRQYIVSKPK